MHGARYVRMIVFAALSAALCFCPQIRCEEFEVKSIGPAVKLTWDGNFGEAYQLWRSESAQGPWEKVGRLLPGSDAEMCTYADAPQGRVWFYRIEALPGAPPGMVAIPGGTFEMGDHFGDGVDTKLLVHTVRLDSFFMDAKEVTTAQYCTFLNSLNEKGLITPSTSSREVRGPCPILGWLTYAVLSWRTTIYYDSDDAVFRINPGREGHPAVCVTWRGAVAYCNWRSEREGFTPWYGLLGEFHFTADGYRLPTEAEWEYAARGDLQYAMYPWGNEIDGTKANFRDSGDPYEDEPVPTTPVAYYSPNAYGLFDMAGNAPEWCYDSYKADYYQYCIENNIVDNPTGPPVQYKVRALRGGSWHSRTSHLRCSSRNATESIGTAGFRCVRRPRGR